MRAIEHPRTAPDLVPATGGRPRVDRALLYLALVACSLACRSGRKVEPPLATPLLHLAVRHHAGGALEGALASASESAVGATSENVLSVRCRFVYLDRFRPEALTSLLESARLVVSDSGNQPLITHASRELGLRVGGGEPAIEFVHQLEGGGFDRRVVAGELHEVLPEGVTLVVSCREHESANPARAENEEDNASFTDTVPLPPFALLLARGTGARSSTLMALFALEDTTQSESNGMASSVDRDRRRGIVLSESPELDGAPLVIVIPAHDDPVPTAALALVVEVSRPGKTAGSEAWLAEALARCSRDIAAESNAARESAQLLSPEGALEREMVCALQALEIARFHRSALAYLAKASAAPLSESLALVAEPDPLREYVAAVIQACGGAQALTRASPALGWNLERTAYLFLADMAVQAELPPELAALLIRNAGEGGRYPDELEDAVKSSRDLPSLRARFVAANRYALQDDRPASRVRAFDWLSARGLAPQGYDPLASEHARHAALERAAQALEATGREAASTPEEKPR